jgi:hypothetical protein
MVYTVGTRGGAAPIINHCSTVFDGAATAWMDYKLLRICGVTGTSSASYGIYLLYFVRGST